MMIKRNVSFQLTADGSVTPSVPQYGGVKGEHNVTTVGFILNTNAVSVEGDVVRLSFYTGDGAVLSTDLLEDITVDAATDHAYIRYPLPQNLTVAGGQLCVRLILSRMDEDGNEVEVFRSGEAVLYFDEAPVENGTPFWTGVSEMLKRTVTAKEAAVEAQQVAMTSASFAQTMRAQAEAAAAQVSEDAEGMRTLHGNVQKAAEAVSTAQQSAAQDAQVAAESRQEAKAAANMAFAHRQGADAAAQVAEEAAQAAVEAVQKASRITDVGNGLGLEDGTVFVDPTYIDGKISAAVSSVYRFKGSVPTGPKLYDIQNPQVGDVYNVTLDGMNYAWDGTNWDALGSHVTAKDSMSGTSNESGVPVSGVAVAQYVQERMAGLSVGAGIYVGSGDMPEDCVVQIDPNGDVLDGSFIEDMITEAITAYDTDAAVYLEQASASLAEAMALLGNDEVMGE